VRRPFFALALLLLTAACAAPRAVAVEGGGSSGTAAGAMDLDFREAGRRAPPMLSGTVPAMFRLPPAAPVLPRARPAMVATKRPLQCVPYARAVSGINLRGDAWTWWAGADGRFAKGDTPRPGAILVLSKTRRLRLGHLAVVAEVLGSRDIVVHQANWLNGGRIHRYTPVRDVSPDNDWSQVRVWYTPGRVYGARTYAAYGFIYPKPDGQPDLRQAAR
jgi:hypothetical protein